MNVMNNMENNFLNGLQLYKGKWFSDLVDESNLANALLIEPHKVSNVISYIFGMKDDAAGSSLDFLTGGLGKTMTIDSRMYEWNVLIDTDRAVNIRGAYYQGSPVNLTTKAGLGNTPIMLHLEDKWLVSRTEPRLVVILG